MEFQLEIRIIAYNTHSKFLKNDGRRKKRARFRF